MTRREEAEQRQGKKNHGIWHVPYEAIRSPDKDTLKTSHSRPRHAVHRLTAPPFSATGLQQKAAPNAPYPGTYHRYTSNKNSVACNAGAVGGDILGLIPRSEVATRSR